MMKFKNKPECQNCGAIKRPELIACKTCGFDPQNRKDLWKPANLGKQRIKPVTNRTGKKQTGQPKLHHH